MKLENEYLDTLPYFYAVAVGRVSGIFGEWNIAEKQVDGFKNPVHKGFSNKHAAVRFLVDKLSLKSKERALTNDETETFTSAQTLLEGFPPDLIFPSLV